MTSTGFLSVFAPSFALGGPVLLGLWGVLRSRGQPRAASPSPAWDWKLILASMLLYALSFSLIFFVQELFLVLPKAFTPGLRPTLFHNNHNWDGDNPLAKLFQGTGALATLILAALCAYWLKRCPPRSALWRMFALWMVFHGCYQALPQFVVGAIFPGNDVGMAMEYLQWSAATKTVAALLAMALIVWIAVRLLRPLLSLAAQADEVATPGRRAGFVFRVATLPGLLALPLIIAMRVPGSLDQVAIVPVAEYVIGLWWMQAAAWFAIPARAGETAPVRSIAVPLLALIALTLIFHLILRPGIAFY